MIPGELCHGTGWLWSSFALDFVGRIGGQQQKGTALMVKGTEAAKSEKK